MRVTFESKGDFKNTLDWLSKGSKGPSNAIINQIAKDGKEELTANTPRATGETAEGWQSRITKQSGGSAEIAWINTAHPESNVSVAKLIDQGHGTRNGGYVPPRPYIKKSMDSVWRKASDRLAKGMTR